MRSTRKRSVAAIVMLIVSVVQLGWWCYDQYAHTAEQQRAFLALYQQQVEGARAMLAAGVPAERVGESFRGVDLSSGEPRIAPAAIEALARDRWHQLNQYMWESAFFFVVLCAGIAVIWRALAEETRVVREQDSFLALVSHQFKTPLASLQLSLETMQIRKLDVDHSRELMDRMLADVARMEAMVTQILDGVRVDRGRVELRPEPVSLTTAVSHVTQHLEPRARREGIELVADLPASVGAYADPMAMDVVIRNVVENALAAVSPLGGGTIRISARELPGQVALVVTDSGVGFDAADRERMFEKYARLDTGGVVRYHGTGLGLYIVQRLMRLSGGSVVAASAGLGQGATFTLSWPTQGTGAA